MRENLFVLLLAACCVVMVSMAVGVYEDDGGFFCGESSLKGA